jgi:hypothetical protein
MGGVKRIDLVQRTVIGLPIETGPNPTSVAIAPDGNHAYVLNSGDGTMVAIRLATNQVDGDPIGVGCYRSVARRRLLAAEQLRHLEAAADSLFTTDVVPRSGIKLLDAINGAGTVREGGDEAEYIMRDIRWLREATEKPCPKCESWPTGFNNGLTNKILDLRQRLDGMMDKGWPTRAEGQPLLDVLTSVGMELGFW